MTGALDTRSRGVELDEADRDVTEGSGLISRAPAPPTASTTVLSGDDATRRVITGRHLVTVPALLPMAGTLREAVGGFLAAHRRSADARQIIDEFATTALIEQRCTCCPIGQLSLTVDCDEQRIRLELAYHHNLSHAPVWEPHEVDNYCLGLAIINRCSDRWGHSAFKRYPLYANDEHTWWAELDHLPRPPTPVHVWGIDRAVGWERGRGSRLTNAARPQSGARDRRSPG